MHSHPCSDSSVPVRHSETCQQIEEQLQILQGQALPPARNAANELLHGPRPAVVLADTAGDVGVSATSSHSPTAVFLEQSLCLPRV